MVEFIDSIFEALHQIIISFFFKLAIFTPALVNAVLVGFGVGSFASQKWGFEAGLISGLVTAVAIEAASIVASFNLNVSKLSSYVLPVLYISGSWVVVWFGLREGWQIDVIGFVMPIFAISLPAVIASRKQYLKDIEAERQKQDRLIAFQIERTKQERAKARAIKYKSGNYGVNGQKNSDIPPVEDIMEKYGVKQSRAYEIRRELINSTTTTENVNNRKD